MVEELEKIAIHKIAHEIKNSLSICSGYLEILSRNENDASKYLEIINKELLKVIKMTNKTIENPNLIKETFKLNSLLEELKESLSYIFEKNNAKLIISKKDITINADYDKLRQVFLNILKNSLEAKNKENLIIKVKTFYDNNKCIIYISDNGIGMKSSELSKIFHPYYTKKKNGTGLGTINIKEIIELHNGTIEYRSTPKIGTTAIIKLPITNNSN